jgi:hypothetical protein
MGIARRCAGRVRHVNKCEPPRIGCYEDIPTHSRVRVSERGAMLRLGAGFGAGRLQVQARTRRGVRSGRRPVPVIFCSR